MPETSQLRKDMHALAFALAWGSLAGIVFAFGLMRFVMDLAVAPRDAAPFVVWLALAFEAVAATRPAAKQ